MKKINEEIIMKNEDFKMIKLNENEYKILDDENNCVFKIEGSCSYEELKEHFNNLHKGFQII